MSQVTVRLANEGVPVQAIARAVGLPSADVRAQLANALLTGDLVTLPLNDWPNGERRQAKFSDSKMEKMEQAARRVLRLTPLLAKVLMPLLTSPEVSRAFILKLLNGNGEKLLNDDGEIFIRVTMLRLRRRLDAFGVAVHTMYGFGYCITLAHQRKLRALLKA